MKARYTLKHDYTLEFILGWRITFGQSEPLPPCHLYVTTSRMDVKFTLSFVIDGQLGTCTAHLNNWLRPINEMMIVRVVYTMVRELYRFLHKDEHKSPLKQAIVDSYMTGTLAYLSVGTTSGMLSRLAYEAARKERERIEQAHTGDAETS